MRRTVQAMRYNDRIQSIRGVEKNLHVLDESLRHKNAFHVRSIADMKKHIRNASGGCLLKGGQNTPDAVRFFFHLLFLYADFVSFCFAGILV